MRMLDFWRVTTGTEWNLVYESFGHIVDIVNIIISLDPFRHLRIYFMLSIWEESRTGMPLDDRIKKL